VSLLLRRLVEYLYLPLHPPLPTRRRLLVKQIWRIFSANLVCPPALLPGQTPLHPLLRPRPLTQ
jgi:hypothetical protein